MNNSDEVESESEVLHTAWRMLAWAEQMGTATAGSGDDAAAKLKALASELRVALTGATGGGADRCVTEKDAAEVCPLCKGPLTASGLQFASCGAGHRWLRCCYSLALLSTQATEPGGWLRSSICKYRSTPPPQLDSP